MFKVGDRVVLKKDVSCYVNEGHMLKGATGIVVSLDYYPEDLGIFWDGFTEGHNCGVGGGGTSGWFVDTAIIEIEEEENE